MGGTGWGPVHGSLRLHPVSASQLIYEAQRHFPGPPWNILGKAMQRKTSSAFSSKSVLGAEGQSG